MSTGLSLAFDEDLGAGQNLSYTASSVVSTELAAGRYVILATTDCHVKLGASGVVAVADTGSFIVKAGERWFFTVRPKELGTGERSFIAAIRDVASGTLYVRRVVRP